MSLEQKIFKGVSWMAFFNLFSQGFSWAITILIARILVPGDYGLMAMSTIITGYALSLSDLGLGNAIIQRQDVNNNHLSSIFWFSMMLSITLALSCFPVAYLTANIMHEPRVIPITQVVSILFILNGLQIVPTGLLKKSMDFKSIGIIDLATIIISSVSMFAIAKTGGGVWTLIYGNIIRSLMRTLLLYIKSGWRPKFHFNFSESRPFISFGVKIALGSSLYYVREKSDKFFAGRAWQVNLLGFYTFAMDLAAIPTDKIVSLINSVSYPAFARVQSDPIAFKKLYLNISKVTASIVLPLFAGGYVLGADLIKLLLDDKWLLVIPLFKTLCLVQILTSMVSINTGVHAAQGRPAWTLYYNIVSVIFMPLSFFIAVPFGLQAIIIPWITTYVVLSCTWIYITMRKLRVQPVDYFTNLIHPIAGTTLMCVLLFTLKNIVAIRATTKLFSGVYLFSAVITGVAVYLSYFFLFNRKFVNDLRNLRKQQ